MLHSDRVAGAENCAFAQILPADQGPPAAVLAWQWLHTAHPGPESVGGDLSPHCFAHTVLASAAAVVLRPCGTQMSARWAGHPRGGHTPNATCGVPSVGIYH